MILNVDMKLRNWKNVLKNLNLKGEPMDEELKKDLYDWFINRGGIAPLVMVVLGFAILFNAALDMPEGMMFTPHERYLVGFIILGLAGYFSNILRLGRLAERIEELEEKEKEKE